MMGTHAKAAVAPASDIFAVAIVMNIPDKLSLHIWEIFVESRTFAWEEVATKRKSWNVSGVLPQTGRGLCLVGPL